MSTDPRALLRESHPDLDRVDHNEFGRRQLARQLRETRKARGLTQREVAERSGMNQSQIATLESPRGGMPLLETIQRYMRACNAPVYIGFPHPGDIAREDAGADEDGDSQPGVTLPSEDDIWKPEPVSRPLPEQSMDQAFREFVADLEKVKRDIDLFQKEYDQDVHAKGRFRNLAACAGLVREVMDALHGLEKRDVPAAKKTLVRAKTAFQKRHKKRELGPTLDERGRAPGHTNTMPHYLGATRVELMDIVAMQFLGCATLARKADGNVDPTSPSPDIHKLTNEDS